MTGESGNMPLQEEDILRLMVLPLLLLRLTVLRLSVGYLIHSVPRCGLTKFRIHWVNYLLLTRQLLIRLPTRLLTNCA